MRKIASLCLAAGLLQSTAFAEEPARTTPLPRPVAGAESLPDQSVLKPNTAITGPTLKFDWPALQIGAGTYEEGPTGVTMFVFPEGANAVVDVRGGAPGTVNTDLLRLGYSAKSVAAIVLAGGSAYGEEAIAGVQTGFKDMVGRGHTGIVPGAIINDLAHLRLNWYYPDRKLARAILQNLRPGVFPLGSQGAGRMAQNGLYYGCRNHSGQGGAFRQIGDVKIAVFTVVNALGAIVDRNGRLVRCHRDPSWPADESAADLINRIANRTLIAANDAAPDPAIEAKRAGTTRATTISLIVTNRKMSVDDLQRFAVQVHTSMARGIWPFSTGGDGDTLFAASTQEVEVSEEKFRTLDMDVIAGELMWDAILASVPPEDPAIPGGAAASVPVGQLTRFVGRYDFGAASPIDIKLEDGALAIGSETLAYADIPKGKTAKLVAIAADDFYVPGRYRTRIKFTVDKGGRVVGAVIDPGLWGQRGVKLQ
jgi:L-aminopeptidase/D-esterase-like protein